MPSARNDIFLARMTFFSQYSLYMQ